SHCGQKQPGYKVIFEQTSATAELYQSSTMSDNGVGGIPGSLSGAAGVNNGVSSGPSGPAPQDQQSVAEQYRKFPSHDYRSNEFPEGHHQQYPIHGHPSHRHHGQGPHPAMYGDEAHRNMPPPYHRDAEMMSHRAGIGTPSHELLINNNASGQPLEQPDRPHHRPWSPRGPQQQQFDPAWRYPQAPLITLGERQQPPPSQPQSVTWSAKDHEQQQQQQQYPHQPSNQQQLPPPTPPFPPPFPESTFTPPDSRLRDSRPVVGPARHQHHAVRDSPYPQHQPARHAPYPPMSHRSGDEKARYSPDPRYARHPYPGAPPPHLYPVHPHSGEIGTPEMNEMRPAAVWGGTDTRGAVPDLTPSASGQPRMNPPDLPLHHSGSVPPPPSSSEHVVDPRGGSRYHQYSSEEAVAGQCPLSVRGGNGDVRNISGYPDHENPYPSMAMAPSMSQQPSQSQSQQPPMPSSQQQYPSWPSHGSGSPLIPRGYPGGHYYNDGYGYRWGPGEEMDPRIAEHCGVPPPHYPYPRDPEMYRPPSMGMPMNIGGSGRPHFPPPNDQGGQAGSFAAKIAALGMSSSSSSSSTTVSMKRQPSKTPVPISTGKPLLPQSSSSGGGGAASLSAGGAGGGSSTQRRILPKEPVYERNVRSSASVSAESPVDDYEEELERRRFFQNKMATMMKGSKNGSLLSGKKEIAGNPDGEVYLDRMTKIFKGMSKDLQELEKMWKEHVVLKDLEFIRKRRFKQQNVETDVDILSVFTKAPSIDELYKMSSAQCHSCMTKACGIIYGKLKKIQTQSDIHWRTRSQGLPSCYCGCNPSDPPNAGQPSSATQQNPDGNNDPSSSSSSADLAGSGIDGGSGKKW
ncbi:hypothetical protein HDU76_009511, partial [Blyttiomyces sp. JEL0837]